MKFRAMKAVSAAFVLGTACIAVTASGQDADLPPTGQPVVIAQKDANGVSGTNVLEPVESTGAQAARAPREQDPVASVRQWTYTGPKKKGSPGG